MGAPFGRVGETPSLLEAPPIAKFLRRRLLARLTGASAVAPQLLAALSMATGPGPGRSETPGRFYGAGY